MQGTFYINGKDAYTTWGITLDDTALSALMTPAPLKDPVSNRSRASDGVQVVGLARRQAFRPYQDEREFTLGINLTATNEAEFFKRYEAFCRELEGGVLDLRTKWQQGITYRCLYVSCNQFSQFMRGVGKFSLRLREPNPNNRR